MALSKRNSRPIEVDGVRYRWAFSAPYDSDLDRHRLNLTIQPENGLSTKLIGTGECHTNNDHLLESTVIMTPAIVSTIIRDAIAKGWTLDGDKDWFVNEIEQFAPMESRKSRY